jgi:hypothetical protein
VLPLDYLAVVLLSVLAVAMVVWYFRMRRVTLQLVKRVTDELEGFFKPVDKTYVLLGYLVGYRAMYTLKDGDRVFAVLTTVPRHSLLYYPLAKALGRTDRLHLAVKYGRRYVVRELHAVNLADTRLHAVVLKDLGERARVLSKRELELRGDRYVVYYEDSGDLELVAKLVESSPATLYKVSAYSRDNLVEVVADVSSGNALAIAEILRDFSRRITRS